MKCADLLNEVAELVGGVRNDQHGEKHDNFSNIARYWTAHLNAKGIVGTISAEDVALMMVLLKVARTKTGSYNKDDYADMCGYGSIAYELAEMTEQLKKGPFPVKDMIMPGSTITAPSPTTMGKGNLSKETLDQMWDESDEI